MRKHPLYAYLTVLTVLSAGFIVSMRLVGERGFFLAQFYMLGPAIAAIISRQWFYEGRFRDAGLRSGAPRDWLLGYGLSLGVTVLAFALFTLFGAVRWDLTGQTFLKQLRQQMTGSGASIDNLPAGMTPEIMLLLFALGGLTVLNLFPGLITGFGEEFGARGLMFPLMLRQWGVVKALAAGSVIWFAWHVPITLVFPEQTKFTPMEQVVNTSVLLAGAFLTFVYLAYMYLRSGSILVASFAHIVMNNAGRTGAYFVEVRNQTLANVGLTLAFAILCAALYACGELRVFDQYRQAQAKALTGATA